MKVEENNELSVNLVELNAILYYSDFISLREESKTVTDNCKYFFIHGTPMNSAYMADVQPFFDANNKWFKQAMDEYLLIKTKFGDAGIMSFMGGICNLAAIGCVDAKRMLTCIHQYSDKYTRRSAFKRYDEWINNQFYTHWTINEKGEPILLECTRYIAHLEQGTDRRPKVHYFGKPTK